MKFYAKLRLAQQKNNSLLCVGLDPEPHKVPNVLGDDAHSILEFNKRIIEATKDLVCAYKLNLAFYESLGEYGWKIVHETLACIPGDLVTIGDAKRGDIGNSARLYAKLLLEDFKFTATTASPYMGLDSLQPFMKNPGQGVFILAVTSNPGARDFQYLKANERPLFEHVTRRVKRWNIRNNCGLVVGATRPRELRRIRTLVPEMPILIPGIGTQQGDLRSAVRFGCTEDGWMAIINASRSIIYASDSHNFDEAARTASLTLQDQINSYRRQFF